LTVRHVVFSEAMRGGVCGLTVGVFGGVHGLHSEVDMEVSQSVKDETMVYVDRVSFSASFDALGGLW